MYANNILAVHNYFFCVHEQLRTEVLPAFVKSYRKTGQTHVRELS